MATKLLAFDLDGTLTQHKTALSPEYREFLTKLSEKYTLVMVGAGKADRIFNQMEGFPIDIIGNYGMQYAKYNPETKGLDLVYDITAPCDKEECERRITFLREKHGVSFFGLCNLPSARHQSKAGRQACL